MISIPPGNFAKISLRSSGGSMQIDISAIINRFERVYDSYLEGLKRWTSVDETEKEYTSTPVLRTRKALLEMIRIFGLHFLLKRTI